MVTSFDFFPYCKPRADELNDSFKYSRSSSNGEFFKFDLILDDLIILLFGFGFGNVGLSVRLAFVYNTFSFNTILVEPIYQLS